MPQVSVARRSPGGHPVGLARPVDSVPNDYVTDVLRPTPAHPASYGAASPATLARELTDFLVELSVALHRRAMYPGGHPSLATAEQRVMRRVTPLLADTPVLAVGVARDQLVIDGVATDPKHHLLRGLAQRLHEHRLAGFRFQEGLTTDEVTGFLQRLARDPEEHVREPLSVPGTSNSPWPHIGVYRQSYERLELADGEDDEDGLVAGALPRAAQLWLDLAQAAMTAVEIVGGGAGGGGGGDGGSGGGGYGDASGGVGIGGGASTGTSSSGGPSGRGSTRTDAVAVRGILDVLGLSGAVGALGGAGPSGEPGVPGVGLPSIPGVPRGGGGTGTGGGIGAGIGPGVGSGVGGGPSGEATNGELAPEGGGPTGLSASSIAGAAAALGLPLPQAAPASAAPTGPATARTAAGGEGTATPVEPPPVDTDPTAVAKAINVRRGEAAYEQAVVGYLLQIAQELRTSEGADTAVLRSRVSGLVRSLSPEAIRRLLEMGGNLTQRRTFLTDASAGMATDAVLTLTVAAAQVSQQAISETAAAFAGQAGDACQARRRGDPIGG